MIDAAPQIEPNDGIGRAMSLSLLLPRKLGHRVLRSGDKREQNKARNSAAYYSRPGRAIRRTDGGARKHHITRS